MRISDWSSDVCSSDLAAVGTPTSTASARRAGAGIGAGRFFADDRAAAGDQVHHRTNDAQDCRTDARGRHHAGWRSRGNAAREGRQRHVCARSEEHTSELQSLMRISYAVSCLKEKKTIKKVN